MNQNIRPCVAPGFCAINGCNIEDNDVLLFFNTRKSNYDKYLDAIFTNAPKVFKRNENFHLSQKNRSIYLQLIQV